MAYWNSLTWFPIRNAARAASTEFAEIVDSPDFTMILIVKPVTRCKVCRRLAIQTSREEFLQPRGKNNDPHVVHRTDPFEYLGVLTPDAGGIGRSVLVKYQYGEGSIPSPLIERIHWCSVHLNEIHMGNGNRNLEEFPAQMGHGGESFPKRL